MKTAKSKKKSKIMQVMTVREYKRLYCLGFEIVAHFSAEKREAISAVLKEAATSAPKFVTVKHTFYDYDYQARAFTPEKEPVIIRGLLIKEKLYIRPHIYYIIGKSFQILEKYDGLPQWASDELAALAFANVLG